MFLNKLAFIIVCLFLLLVAKIRIAKFRITRELCNSTFLKNYDALPLYLCK